MGGRQWRRTPTYPVRPAENYFWAGILLCCTVGMVAAGVWESWRRADWGWVAVFLTGEAIAVVLYFWIVASWLKWMTPSDDDQDEPCTVACSYDRHHHRR